jgi:DNA-binding CsgD family transcriptional regulator
MINTHIELTPRERQCLQCLLEGMDNKDIANTLNIAPNTVKVYLSRLGDKLGVHKRFAMAQWARAYEEGRRRIAARYKEVFPDEPEMPHVFELGEPCEYDVFLALARTTSTLTNQQRATLIAVLV